MRKTNAIGKRLLATLLAAALSVSALPVGALAAETEAACTLEEHTHTEECYGQELTCGEEGEAHTHSQSCYLTCGKVEHTHGEDCGAVTAEEETPATEAVTEAAAAQQTYTVAYYSYNSETDELTPLSESTFEGAPGEVKLFTAPEGYAVAYVGIDFNTAAEIEQVTDASVNVTLPEANTLVVMYDAGASTLAILHPDTTPVLTYVFYSGETEVSRCSVKDGETLTVPASPEKTGYKFTGWATEDGTAITSGTVSVSETKEIKVKAQFVPVYYVFFMDSTGDNARVIATKEGVTDDQVSTADVTFAVKTDEAITGWYTDASLTGNAVGKTVTIGSSNITLYPKVEKGYWITYDSDGGTYIAPEFVEPSAATAAPTNPTKTGYTFAGWYCENTEFTFGEELTEDITLTAHWTGNADTAYTVIYWVENADYNNTYLAESARDAEQYSYITSVTKTGTAGEMTAEQGNLTGITMDPALEKNISLAKIENTTIEGDGSTIVNVYYDRKTYTLTFHGEVLICEKEEHTHSWWDGCYDRRWNLICTKEAHTHINSCYFNGTYTITAKYGANISSAWPKNSQGYTNWFVEYRNGKTVQEVYMETMPGAGEKHDFYQPDEEWGSSTAYYYVEVLSGESGIVYEGKTYKLDHTDTSSGSGLNVTSEDRYPITGFTLNADISTQVGSSYNNAAFYYTRNSYTIHFINGDEGSTQEKLYQEDISGVSDTPERPTGIPEGYTFLGWYADEACTKKYTFAGTMPARDITVYAKWAAPTDTATIYLTIGGTGNAVTLSIPYGGSINESSLEQYKTEIMQTVGEGHAWQGWYTGPNGSGSSWNFDTKVYENIALYPYYTSTASYTVTYDTTTNGGSGTVTDSKKYAEGAHADVQPFAGTAPENKVFLYWSDGTTNYYPNDKLPITGNVTLTAVYGPMPTTTTLTYTANGGTGADVVKTHANNEGVTVASNLFTRTGYTFTGWNTAADGSGSTYGAGSGIIVDATGTNILYAQWTKASYTLSIHYRYTDGSKASDDHTETCNYGDAYSVDSPAINGYTASLATVSGTMPADNLEVTITYTANTHTVIYKITGTYFASASYHRVENVPYGTALTLIADDMTKTGYTWSGWSGLPATMPDSDVKVTGYYTPNTDVSYTVNYLEQGTSTALADQKTVTGQTFGSSVTERAISITGYTAVAPTSTTITLDAYGKSITFYYAKDNTQTQDTSYTVKYTIEGVEQTGDAIMVTGTAWINDSPAQIAIAEGGIPAPADKYTGYKLDTSNPEYPAADTKVDSGTEYTVNYVKDESQTKTIRHIVKHIVNGIERTEHTKTYTDTAWINETAPMIAVAEGSLAPNTYDGHRYVAMEPEVEEGDLVAHETEIKLIYVKENTVSYTWTGLPTDGTKLYDAEGNETIPTVPTDSGAYVEGETYTVDGSYTSGTAVYTHDAYGNVNGKYTFGGWDKAGTQTMGEADITVTGKWTYAEVAVETHKVSYAWTNAPTGENSQVLPQEITGLISGETYTVDTTYSKNQMVIRKDASGKTVGAWVFSGWTDPGEGVMGDEDIVITGEWVENIALTVSKTWILDNGGKQADQVTVALYYDGQEIDELTLNAANDWTYTLFVAADSDMSKYTVRETNVPSGFEATVERNGNTFTVTNNDQATGSADNTNPKTADTFALAEYVTISAMACLLLLLLDKRRASRKH